MGNRKQPFGYRMEMGKIVADAQEAEVVNLIFREYLAGASFNSLVNALKNQDIPYDQGKLWNKNMVARILEDRRYVGKNQYPTILPGEAMDAAAKLRASRQRPTQRTKAQKVLRQLSGHPATERMERTVLDLLNNLIKNPEKITASNKPLSKNSDMSLHQELERIMNSLHADEDRAKDLIFQIAARQYASIGPGDYETERLKRLFAKAEPMETLDADLLKNVVASVQIRGDRSIVLRLKNHQVIEG